MKIDDYVTTVLCGIIDGVVAAQEKFRKQDVRINPCTNEPEGKTVGENKPNYWPVRDVEFEIGVVVEDSSKGSAGVGVFVGPFSAGGATKSESLSKFVNTVRFKIPIALPPSGRWVHHPDASDAF